MDNTLISPTVLAGIPTEVLIKLYGEDRRVEINGVELKPERSLKIRNHSPDGFNWGYPGSGPAQLALAILLEFMPETFAVGLYQQFKFHVVATWVRSYGPGYHGINLNLQEEITKILNKDK